MAEQRTFAPVAERNDQGIMLKVAGGETLPFTEEQLLSRGMRVTGEPGNERVVVVDEDRFQKTKAEFRPEVPAQEEVAQVAPTQPEQVAQAPAPEPAPTPEPSPEETVLVAGRGEEPMALSPAEIPPEGMVSIPGISQAQAAPAGQPTPSIGQTIMTAAGDAYDYASKIVDDAIAYSQGIDRSDAEAALPDDERIRGDMPLVMPRTSAYADRTFSEGLPKDYFTRMFFTDIQHPTDPEVTPQQFTLSIHDKFRSAKGFRKPAFKIDPDNPNQFLTDEDGNIQVMPGELDLIPFDSEDLDDRTRQFIEEGGYALQQPTGQLNFVGDILSEEVKQRSRELNGLQSLAQSPIYMHMSEEGGAERVRQVLQANGVSLADQVYLMRRLEDAPIFIGQDLNRLSYVLDNGWGALWQFGGMTVEGVLDAGIFLTSWMMALGTDFPDAWDTILKGNNPEFSTEMSQRISDNRARAKGNTVISKLVSMGWDATQRYAEDHGMSYEQARAALQANRGFMETAQWFFAENLGFSGPIMALRTFSGIKSAKKIDEFILEEWGTPEDRALYLQAGRTLSPWSGDKVVNPMERYEVINRIIQREQDLDETFMATFSNAFRESKQFSSMSSYQKRTADAHWMRDNYLQQRPKIVAKVRELRGQRDEASRKYHRLNSQANPDRGELNKARADLYRLNTEIAQTRAIGILPDELKGAMTGDLSTALAAAAGYSIAYSVTPNTQSQDFATLLGISGMIFPPVAGAAKDGANALYVLLGNAPGIRTIFDKVGIARPSLGLYQAQKIIKNADPQLAALIQENINAVGQSIVTADEINALARAQGFEGDVIDTSLYIQSFAKMAAIPRIDAAVSNIGAAPKMGEVLAHGEDVKRIADMSIERISLRNQLAQAILVLRGQLDNLPEGIPRESANRLQNDLNMMQEYVEAQDLVIRAELQAQAGLWDEVATQVEEVLLNGTSSKYLGTEVERLAEEAQQSGKPMNLRGLVDLVLSRDALKEAGMSMDQIERVERVTDPLREYLISTETGLQTLDNIFNKAIHHISEFNSTQKTRVSTVGSAWIYTQSVKMSERFRDQWNNLDATYADHRMPITTPFRLETDTGEVKEMKSVLDALEGGEYYLEGVNDQTGRLIGGSQLDPTVRVIHELAQEGADATLRHLNRNVPEAEEAFMMYLDDINASRIAAEQPPIDPEKLTSLQRWEMMGKAMVEFGVVESMEAYKTGVGRIGIKPKDYRILISHLGARGNAAKGWAEYSHFDLRGDLLDRATAFEGNFFDVNMGAVAITGEAFKRDFEQLRGLYREEAINAFRNDPFVRKILKEIGDQRMDPTNFWAEMTRHYKLDKDDANIEGFQNFWGRMMGTRDESGKFVIDLDTDEGKQLKGLLEAWGMSLLTETVAGKRALMIRHNAAKNLRADAFAPRKMTFAEIRSRSGNFVPDKLPELEEAYQRDLPWEEFTVLANLEAVVTVNGKKSTVPLINMDRVYAPIMPEFEGGSLGEIETLVRKGDRARRRAAVEARRIVQQEIDLINDLKNDQSVYMNMWKGLFIDLGKGQTPEIARKNIMDMVASGPGGAQRLKQFKKTYVEAQMQTWKSQNPGATDVEIGAQISRYDEAYKQLMKTLAIDYLFEQAASAGASQVVKTADGNFIQGNPANVDGRIIFELLGMETLAGGTGDRAANFQAFFEEVGGAEELDQLKWIANQLFEATPDGNIRIANMPTPINLNHVATRVVAGLRGQVSPRWLIIEHLLRQKSIAQGKTFMMIMTDPEIGEALIDLATKRDLSPKEIESRIDKLWKITKFAARSEWVEQNIYQDMRNDYRRYMNPELEIEGP